MTDVSDRVLPQPGTPTSAKDRTRLLKAKVEAHFHGRSGAQVGLIDEYRILREVSCDDMTDGFTRRRRVDLVAVGVWKRTAHVVHGIETKVSRVDWLTELRDPAKAAAGARNCHAWWVAVDDPAIVKDGELPDGWGLLIPSGNGMRKAVRATLTPRDLDPRWVAALIVCAATQHSGCRGLARMEERVKSAQKVRDLESTIRDLRWQVRDLERQKVTADA